MIFARSISIVLAIAIAPALSSCASRSMPPVTPGLAPQTVTAPQTGVVVPHKKPTLTGTWKGSWDSGTSSGTFTMHLTQKRKTFSGTVSISIKSSVIKGSVKGTVRKTKLALTVSAQGLGTGHGTAQVNKARTTMNGSVSFKGAKSTFSGSKT